MQDKCNHTYKTNREQKLIEVSFLVWTAMCVWIQASLLALTTSPAKQLPLTCVKFEQFLPTWGTPLAQVRHYSRPLNYSRCKHQPRSWYQGQNSHTTTLEPRQHNRFVVLWRPWGNCHLNCNCSVQNKVLIMLGHLADQNQFWLDNFTFYSDTILFLKTE